MGRVFHVHRPWAFRFSIGQKLVRIIKESVRDHHVSLLLKSNRADVIFFGLEFVTHVLGCHRFMTFACATVLVGIFDRPQLFASVVRDALVGFFSDIAFDFSFRFDATFTWPRSLPMPNLVQLAFSLFTIGAKYLFVIFCGVMKYMIGPDTGAAWLNQTVLTIPATMINSTIFGLARVLAIGQRAAQLRENLRRSLQRLADENATSHSAEEQRSGEYLDLAISWVGLYGTVGERMADCIVSELASKKMRLDMRDPQSQEKPEVLKTRNLLLHALGCSLEDLDSESRICDGALTLLAKSCFGGSHIAHLDLSGCVRITHSCVENIRRLCPELTSINLSNCDGVGEMPLDLFQWRYIKNRAPPMAIELKGLKLPSNFYPSELATGTAIDLSGQSLRGAQDQTPSRLNYDEVISCLLFAACDDARYNSSSCVAMEMR